MATKYTVIRDTREKKRKGWMFSAGGIIAGTVTDILKTGDYTLEGLEKKIVIERKASTSEFATNINEERFDDELERMSSFEHPFLVLEFSMDDIINFPVGSGIPAYLWPKLKVTSHYMLKRLLEYQLKYKPQIILAGRDNGKEVAMSLFKRIAELYGKA